MTGFLDPFHNVIEHRRVIEEKSRYVQRARFEWLISKIREMELTHSQLTSEAENRVSPDPLSWSQMIFTDLFGPDISILGDLKTRLSRLENNIKTFKKEASSLSSSVDF